MTIRYSTIRKVVFWGGIFLELLGLFVLSKTYLAMIHVIEIEKVLLIIVSLFLSFYFLLKGLSYINSVVKHWDEFKKMLSAYMEKEGIQFIEDE